MKNMKLSVDWTLAVPAGETYLLKSMIIPSGGAYSFADSAGKPAEDVGFVVTSNESISSSIYPCVGGIWVKASVDGVNLIVDSWA